MFGMAHTDDFTNIGDSLHFVAQSQKKWVLGWLENFLKH